MSKSTEPTWRFGAHSYPHKPYEMRIHACNREPASATKFRRECLGVRNRMTVADAG